MVGTVPYRFGPPPPGESPVSAEGPGGPAATPWMTREPAVPDQRLPGGGAYGHMEVLVRGYVGEVVLLGSIGILAYTTRGRSARRERWTRLLRWPGGTLACCS